MSRIAALNDEEPTQLSSGDVQPVVTREAQASAQPMVLSHMLATFCGLQHFV